MRVGNSPESEYDIRVKTPEDPIGPIKQLTQVT